MKRDRLDIVVVAQRLAPTRAQAQALIMAGKVRVDGTRVDKPGTQVSPDVSLELLAPASPYVSRGGEKLAGALHAFAHFGLDVQGKSTVDIGASTGGFTDCLLQHGARHVVAVDVGCSLLHEKLLTDPRVTVMDRTNARDLRADMFVSSVDLIVVDASFIGLGKLLPAIREILRCPGGELVALIKPQFEAGRREASKGRGVIRDESVRLQVIHSVLDQLSQARFKIVADAPCDLRGPKGNLEHFVFAQCLSPAT